MLFHAPVTTGSEHDPLPIGTWKVTTVQAMPKFNYNPDLFWDANPAHSKATIPSGPNNPVGVAWIDLSEGALRHPRHAGAVARSDTSSRMDACGSRTGTSRALMKWAQPGTPVVFRRVSMRRVDRVRLEKRRRVVLTLGLAFALGALTARGF